MITEQPPVFDESKPFETVSLAEAPAFNPDDSFSEVPVDATMTVDGQPEVEIEPMKDIHTQFKETLDKGLEAINSKFDKSIKTISEDNTMDADIKDTMLKNLEYKKKQAEDNMYIDNAKKLKSMGVNPMMEKQDKPLETPDISPEFAIGGAVGKFGAVPSIIGDIGATVATKGFEGITDMLTPKLKEDNPILYTVLGLASAIAGGSVANPAVEKTLQKGSDIVTGTGELAYNAYKDPMFVKNILSGTSTDTQSLDYLVKRSGETEDSIASIYSQYSKAKGLDADKLSNADKVKAILANTEVGTRVKLDAEFYGDGVLAKQNTLDEKLRGIFQEKTAKGDYSIPALELKQYLNDSSNLYKSAEDALVKYSNNSIKIDAKAVDELEKSITKGLYATDTKSTVDNIFKDLRNPDGLDVEKLLTIKKELNSLNLTSTRAKEAGTVGNFIDNEVKKSLGKDASHLWDEVNKRYSAKKLMEEDNELGKLLIDKVNGTYSDITLGEKILGIEKNGYRTFNMLRDAIGEKEATKVELGMVKSLLDSKMDMSKVIENVERYGFSTVEGRSLLDNLDKVKGMVSDTDAKGLLAKITNKRVGSVGWTDDLVAKLRYSIAGQLWNGIVKRLPSGSDERALDNIGKIIKEDTTDITFKINKDELYDSAFKARERDLKLRVKALEQQGANRTASENKELMKAKGEIATINDALENMPKMIEYKPTNFITTKSGVSIPKSMEQDVETIKTAEKLGQEASLRSQGRTAYNPKGQFQDTKVEPKKTVEVEILNDNKNVPSTELAKPKVEDIIDNEKHIVSDIEGYTIKKKNPTMIINGEEINKTDFDKITKLQSNQSDRIGITKEQKILKDKYSRIYDDIKDMDWKPNKVEENSYPTIEDFMTKQELNKARAYVKGSKTSDTKAAYNKWIDSKKKVNQQMDLLGF